jgi:hypothetical protein
MLGKERVRGANMSDNDEFVLVLYDGSVRELAPDEKARLNKKFNPGDSGRPYIKSRYDERNGWGRLDGYLLRKLLPAGIALGKPILLGGQEID